MFKLFMDKLKSLLKPAIIGIVFITVAINSHAQVLETIQQNFQQYQDHVLQEKIYTHTDKDFYLTGELLWFKVYNVDAGTNAPLNISKVAYVDVLDNANNPVLQAKIALNNGTGNGSFYIPVTLQNGNYKLRAYTAWMKNFDASLYFEKTISIVNPLAEPTAPAKPTAAAYAIRFFPEGGDLINGITSTVGFKATGIDGKGIEVNGVVINQHNDTVARFQSLKFGMGSFTFTPDASNSYKAVMRVGRDNALISDLPAIMPSGYVIHLTTGNNGPELKITTHSEGNQPLYLFAYCGHSVVMAQRILPGADGSTVVQVNKEKLGPGVNHFTLFNSNGQPVCERLYFNRPANLLKVRATTNPQYQTRKPVTVNISANDAAGKPLVANLSFSAYHTDSLNNPAYGDIVSSFWLKSELKGDIESPGYYFDVITSETDKAVDNLLLTQGWSRFKWNAILSGKPKQKFMYLPEYNGHIITGQIVSAAGTPEQDALAYMGIIGKRVQFYGAVSDSTGRLLFNTKDLYGPGELVAQTNTEKDSTSRITIQSPFSEQYATNPLPDLQLGAQVQKQLEANSIAMQVQNLYNANKLKQYYNPHVDSSAFYGNIAKEYKLDDFTRFTTMEEDLREYIAEINVVKQKGRFHIKVISPNGFLEEGDPLVLIDGIPIFNIDKVFTIDPLKVRKLDMFNRAFYTGPVFADGIISYTTYKGDLGGYEINPHAVVLDYEGMQLEREFYSPVYQNESQQKSRLPDFRNVLYWTPDVNTNKDGQATVSFYTSDRVGKYIGVLQGLTADGQAGSYYFNFEVNK